ncbi:hypothetical protein IEQ34_025826 [Dendrobium chrysotoxum]|uniref:Uncharacterized protein n=1 Tax=Dendrobium chrysotoxum TaxID=161865 RepID=A0AAV7FP81_DENCH|nr:hypothetical protein IEQ34_025826 [Dendrobium chrysotoxum]
MDGLAGLAKGRSNAPSRFGNGDTIESQKHELKLLHRQAHACDNFDCPIAKLVPRMRFYRHAMPTIKQLLRNARQPIRNVTKSPALRDVLSVEEHDSERKRERNWRHVT